MGILYQFQEIRIREEQSADDGEDEDINAFIFQLVEIIHNIWYPLKRKKAKKKIKEEEGEELKRELLKDAKKEGDNANALVKKVRQLVFRANPVNNETNNQASGNATVRAVICQLKSEWEKHYRRDNAGKLIRNGGGFYTFLSCLLMSEVSHEKSSKPGAKHIFSGVFTVKYLRLF